MRRVFFNRLRAFAGIACMISATHSCTGPGVEEKDNVSQSCQYFIEDSTKIALSVNVKDPFGGRVGHLGFWLPEPCRVKMTVYNVLGDPVRAWLDDEFEGGCHSVAWDFLDDSGTAVPVGVYFCRFDTEDYSTTWKILKSW